VDGPRNRYQRDLSWGTRDEVEGFGSSAGIRSKGFLIFFNKLKIMWIRICYQHWRKLGPGRGRNEVRTFFGDLGDEIEIPIYDIPVQRT